MVNNPTYWNIHKFVYISKHVYVSFPMRNVKLINLYVCFILLILCLLAFLFFIFYFTLFLLSYFILIFIHFIFLFFYFPYHTTTLSYHSLCRYIIIGYFVQAVGGWEKVKMLCVKYL